MVLLQASRLVFRNSISGFAVATFEFLCLMELLGNLLGCEVEVIVKPFANVLEKDGSYSCADGFKLCEG